MARTVRISAAVLALCTLLAWWITWADHPNKGTPSYQRSLASHASEATSELSSPLMESDAGRESFDPPSQPLFPAGSLTEARGWVRGQVIDTRGNPAPGSAIVVDFTPALGCNILDAEYAKARQPIGRTVCDIDGRFEIAVPMARALDVTARAAGFAPQHAGSVLAGDEVTIRLDLAAELVGSVRVRGESTAVAKACVRARDRLTGALLGEVLTDNNGIFTIHDLRAGFVTLGALSEEAVQSRPALLELVAGQVSQYDFELDRGVTITGRVLDALSKQPIPGAKIATDWLAGKTTEADDSGCYRLAGFGGKRLHARAAGFRGSIQRWESVPHEDSVVNFELERGSTIEGRVIADDGNAIPDAYAAAVSDNAGADHRSQDWKACRADARGRFSISGLDSLASYSLFVQRPRYGTSITNILGNDNIERPIDLGDIVLSKAGTIAGIVHSPAGTTLPNIRLRLNGPAPNHDGHGGQYLAFTASPHVPEPLTHRDMRSDTRGRFLFTDLASGRYALDAWIAEGAIPVVSSIEVIDAPAVTTIDLELEVGEAIEGRVENSEGEGLPSVLVQAFPAGTVEEDPSKIIHVISESNGHFVLRQLTSQRYELVADPVYLNRLVQEPYMKGWSTSIEAGESDARILLRRATVLAGQVKTSDGQPAFDAHVSASVDGVVVDSITANALGSFRMTVPSRTHCRIEAEWTPTGQSNGDTKHASVDGIESGRTDVVLTLDP